MTWIRIHDDCVIAWVILQASVGSSHPPTADLRVGEAFPSVRILHFAIQDLQLLNGALVIHNIGELSVRVDSRHDFKYAATGNRGEGNQ